MRSLSAFVSTVALVLALSACKKGGGNDDPDGGAGDPCISASDCGEAFICAGGFCQLEGSVGLGGPCWANRDCGTDLFCTPAGVCGPSGPGGVGDPCATGAECAKDLTCVLFGFCGTCEATGDGDLGDSCTVQTDCIAGLACAADNTCKAPAVAYPPFTGVECLPRETPFRIYTEVPRSGAPPADFFRLPFPNDARVRSDGTLDLSDFPRPGPTPLGVDLVDLYADTLSADFTGFSSVAAVTFRFSGELDFDSVGPSSAHMHYIDITPASPDYGNDRSRTYSYTTGRGKFICDDYFVVANDAHRPLRPGDTYVVYLDTSIRSAIGEAPVQDDDLIALLGGTRPSNDEDLGRAWDAYQPFRDYLTDAAIAPSTIAGATVFTVQDTTGKTHALATAVEGTALPVLSDVTLCDGTTTSPCDDGGARTCGDSSGSFWEIHGRFSVPTYQQGTAPYALPADGGQVDFVSGVPQQNGSDDVCFVLTIPKSAAPGSGWPLLVYAHGTGGDFKNVVNSGISAELAGATPAMATFSYDGVVHGERRNGHPRDEDSLVFNIINPRGAHGNHLQGAVDVLQAFRVAQLAPFSVGAAGSIDFDATKVYFFGHSQGSNIGVPAVAVTSATPAAVFSGAGAFLTEGLLTKTSPVESKAGLEFLLGEEVTKSHPMMTLFQTYFDAVDTVNFAPEVITRPVGVPAKHVFMTWADDDTFSPRPTLNHMVRALGLEIAEPVLASISNGSGGGNVATVARPVTANVTGGRTGAVFQYDSGGAYDGHFVSTQNDDAVTDWVEFLTSAATDGTPTVP
jgi:predicted esterase